MVMAQQQQTIVIIDDSPEDRKILRQYLLEDGKYNYIIWEEESGEQGLELCRVLKPDGILLDFLLPDLDGIEFLQELKNQTSNPVLPVVMLADRGDVSIAVKAIKSGAQDYLEKEKTTGENLRFALHNVLEKNRLRRELEKSEERFYASMENLLDCFAIYKSIRDESGQILDFRVEYVNGIACEKNRMTKEQQIGKNLCELLPVYRENGLFADYCRVVETGEVLSKVALFYDDNDKQEKLVRAFDIRVSKWDDGVVACWRDISDRITLEEKLSSYQQRFQMVAAAATCLIYEWDVQNDTVERTAGLTQIFGYRLEESQPTRQWWRERIHPDDVERVKRDIQAKLATGDTYAVEYRVRHQNNYYLHVLDQAIVVRDDENKIVRVVGTTTDITATKQAEEEIKKLNRELERRVSELQTLFDVIPVGIAIAHDPECQQMTANSYLSDLLRVSAGKNASKSAPPTEQPLYKVFCHDREVPADELPMQYAAIHGVDIHNVEMNIVHPDRAAIELSCNARPLFDEQGKVRGSVGAFADITKHKQTEQALRRSEALYRYLADAIPQIVWTTDGEGRVEYFNQRWYEYTGLSPEQCLGNWNWLAALHPDDAPLARQIWTASVHKGETYEAEYRLLRASDRTYRWHLARGLSLKDEQGNIIKWFGTCTDIEDQKQIQEERSQLIAREQAAREEAEAANQSKDRFLAVVSHELRSPLNSVLGWAHLLKTRKFDPAITERALETIERNARSLSRLIEDLVDISRMSRGKFQLNIAPVNVQSIVEAAIDIIRPSSEAKNIQIIHKFLSNKLQVPGDATRLQQVILNLLTNAVKFTPEAGKIEIQLTTVDLTKDKITHQYVQIRVTDTGKGIDADFLPSVFDSFCQADVRVTSSNNGLGLGLAIARQLVELHGGTIEATSPGEGKGATFTVTLPLMQ